MRTFAPPSSQLDKFSDYVLNTYINQDTAIFPPVLRANPDLSCPRTTNACETFHSHFNSQFYTSHPDIFTFLEVLKSVQVSGELKQRSSLVDTAARPEKSYKQKMDFIKKYQEQYENDAITRKQYISKISSKAQPVML